MKKIIYLFIVIAVATSCRTEEGIVPSTSTQVTYPDPEVGEIKGFFLLNEGNMGSNKCTLDYYDYATGIYTKNIYAERNPNIVKELGDVGNDIQIYGDRLYCVINGSNLVEVMDLATATHIGSVSIPNCRYIAFKDDYAYVTSYAGTILDSNDRLGYVAKIDLESLEVVAECPVGYQPEELTIAGDKLYVANSGGYDALNYDNRVSVIDLETFTEIKQIEVAINLHRLELDQYGYLWVSSRGDYYDIASKTYVIDTATDEVAKELDVANSNMWRNGDLLYIYSSEWSWYSESADEIYCTIIDTKSQTVVSNNFIADGSEKDIVMPYGLAVNPATDEIFVTDAKDYITPGTIHCYSSDGVHKWDATTGDIPAHIIFTEIQLEPFNNN